MRFQRMAGRRRGAKIGAEKKRNARVCGERNTEQICRSPFPSPSDEFSHTLVRPSTHQILLNVLLAGGEIPFHLSHLSLPRRGRTRTRRTLLRFQDTLASSPTSSSSSFVLTVHVFTVENRFSARSLPLLTRSLLIVGRIVSFAAIKDTEIQRVNTPARAVTHHSADGAHVLRESFRIHHAVESTSPVCRTETRRSLGRQFIPESQAIQTRRKDIRSVRSALLLPPLSQSPHTVNPIGKLRPKLSCCFAFLIT